MSTINKQPNHQPLRALVPRAQPHQAQPQSELQIPRYSIKNTQTGYILYYASDLKTAKHVFYHIPRRKHVDLVLMDNETGEILKIKHAKEPRN